MRSIHWIILIIIVIGNACRASDEKIKKTEVIPKADLVPILVEMHLADGLLLTSKIRREYPGKDSISNYKDVFKKHNVTKEIFDRTIEFYEDEADNLNDLYDEVISELTRLQSEVEQNAREIIPDDILFDLWNQKAVWNLPDDGRINRLAFEIPLTGLGKYVVTATIRMFQDDQSVDPKVTAFFWFDDGTEMGFRIPFETSIIKKNGKITVHTLIENLEDTRATHISGFLLDHTPQSGNWEKHADVLNVKVQHIQTRVKSDGYVFE